MDAEQTCHLAVRRALLLLARTLLLLACAMLRAYVCSPCCTPSALVRPVGTACARREGLRLMKH